MNQTKTARVHVSFRKTLLTLAIVLVIVATGVRAQDKLGDLVTEGGFDWMIGKWVAEDDEGQKVQLVYKWGLDKHLLTVHLKWPNFEYNGLIFYKAPQAMVVQVGVDNKGGNGRGIWDADGNKAINKYEHINVDGQTNRMGIAHSKVDANTMKVEIYELDSTGQLAEYPSFTVEYKRQKEQSPKKCCEQAP